MRAWIFYAPGDLRFEDIEEPHAGQGFQVPVDPVTIYRADGLLADIGIGAEGESQGKLCFPRRPGVFYRCASSLS